MEGWRLNGALAAARADSIEYLNTAAEIKPLDAGDETLLVQQLFALGRNRQAEERALSLIARHRDAGRFTTLSTRTI